MGVDGEHSLPEEPDKNLTQNDFFFLSFSLLVYLTRKHPEFILTEHEVPAVSAITALNSDLLHSPLNANILQLSIKRCCPNTDLRTDIKFHQVKCEVFEGHIGMTYLCTNETLKVFSFF